MKLMKNHAVYLLFIVALCACNPSISLIPAEIKYEVTAKEEDKGIFPDGIVPWINIEKPEIDRLKNKDDIVLKINKAFVSIDYPLNKPVEIEITSPSGKGFSRSDLIQIISAEYHKIYEIEEKTSAIKTIPLSERKKLINRNETNGKYGIWGHDLSDLDLSSINVEVTKDKVSLILNIES